MYRKILVAMALDHDISPKTIEVARALCGEGGKITGLHVYVVPQGSASSYLDENVVRESYERAGSLLKEKLSGVEGVEGVIVKGHSYRAIIEYAHTHDIDCIVLGSHKPGLSDYLIGSTAAKVVRHAPCAVHVYRVG